ncbi:MAG: hypothetical protein WBW47_00190 [Thermoplasmata archaeon]
MPEPRSGDRFTVGPAPNSLSASFLVLPAVPIHLATGRRFLRGTRPVRA